MTTTPFLSSDELAIESLGNDLTNSRAMNEELTRALKQAQRRIEILTADLERASHQAKEQVSLTPELAERIRRIAEADKKTRDQVINDAVTILWIRFGCRNMLRPGEW